MKSLKIKNLYFSSLIIMFAAFLLPSCSKEKIDIPTEVQAVESTEIKLQDLAMELQNDVDFKSLLKIGTSVVSELHEMKETGNFDTFTTLVQAESFVNPYYVLIESIQKYQTNIDNKYPELKSLSSDELENVYKIATEEVSNEKSIPCRKKCNNLFNWLNNNATNNAQSQMLDCITLTGTTDQACMNAVMAWLAGVLQSNANKLEQCKQNCLTIGG